MSHTQIHINEPGASLEERVKALEKQVDFLSKERPGRKMKPNVTSKPGVCGIDPDRDSAHCPDASIYRYQQGCQGDKCVKINRDYYADYRQKRKSQTRPSSEAVVEELPEHNTGWGVWNGSVMPLEKVPTAPEPPHMTPSPPGVSIDDD